MQLIRYSTVIQWFSVLFESIALKIDQRVKERIYKPGKRFFPLNQLF